MDVQKVLSYLDMIEAMCEKVRQEITDGKPRVRITTNQTDSGVTVRQAGRVIVGNPRGVEPPPPPPIVTQCPQTLDFASRIINDPNWPVAVPPDLLCELTDEDLTARADAVLDNMIDINTEGQRFLDFGCGLGFMARQSLLRVNAPAEAVGYDIKRDGWERFRGIPNLRLTDDLSSMTGTFDVILAYDVLDHCESPQEMLSEIHELVSPGGVIYLRCHPWSSRTGGHLYKQINRAYVHLAINDDILRRLGYEVPSVQKILRPLKTYKEWFAQAGFKIRRENPVSEPLENFFRDNAVARIALHRHWDGERNKDKSLTEEKVRQLHEVQFVDYTLQKN